MNSADPVLSVVIPCYNDGRFLGEAVQSAQRCPLKNYEIVVVDDGSTDPGTLALLGELNAQGLRVIHQANRGLGAARNRAIAEARGRYVLPLDADNRVHPDYIEHGIRVLDAEAAVDVVYGDAEFFGERTGRWAVGEFNLLRLLSGNYIDACAVYRKAAWQRCGGYDEKMPVPGFEDWDLWLRIALTGGRFQYLPRPMFDYRVRGDSMSHATSKPELHEAATRYVHAKRIEMSIGDYARPHWSSEFVLQRMRRRPLRTLGSLLARAFAPGFRSAPAPQSLPNERPA